MSQHPIPPKRTLQFLRWFCREDYLDEVEGNLLEIFQKESLSDPRKAKRQFTLNVIRHLRPEYLKLFHRQQTSTSYFSAMISNYIKLAFRNLTKRATFSFINIVGLAFGICACLVILNYIDFETSYDNFHVNASELYRINRTYIQNGDRGMPNTKTTYALGPALMQDLPEVKRYIRVHDGRSVVTYQPSNGQAIAFHEDNILVADSTFFEAFTFAPIAGSLAHSLDNPNSIVLSETVWHKYFGYTDAIGKTLNLSGGRMDGLYTVTAIMKDVPQNSHFSFDMVVPMHNIFLSQQYKKDDGWAWNNFNTYIQLNNSNSIWSAEQKLPDFCKRWMDPKWTAYNGHAELRLQPLLNIHLEPGLRNDVEAVNRSTIYFFGVIAAFILFIAWINYVNLSTARAMERSREVGIKKAIGALRSELMTQFLFESLLINLIAVGLAMILAMLLLPVLSDLTGKTLSFKFSDVNFWVALISLFIVGTFASGVYPAFVLSSFRITKAIKKVSDRGFSMRKALVVFQFVSSIVLIAGTFLVYRQIKFMQSQDTGLQMDQMLVIKGPGILKWEQAQKVAVTFKNEARKIPGVEKIASSGAVPSQEHNWGADIYKAGAPATDARLVSVVFVDPDFVPTYDIEVVAGHNFNIQSKTDMKSAVINEAAVSALSLGTIEEALNQQIMFDGDSVNIIGVVKNFNWNSLKADYTPYMFSAGETIPVEFSVHLRGGSIQTSIEALEKLYKDLMPGEPFEYKFLDDTFNMQYKADQQFGNIFGMFAALAIAICCLGLWGLASFTTSQKLKEIGIRKILGASARSLAYLLVRQFVVLIALSAVVAIPLAWYGMDSWLSSFAFRIGIGWELFVIPILTLTVIALATVGLQIRRGVIMNPADVLRSE